VLLQCLLILPPAVVSSFVIEKDLEGKLLFPKVKDLNELAGAVHSLLLILSDERLVMDILTRFLMMTLKQTQPTIMMSQNTRTLSRIPFSQMWTPWS
jgi:hypothetical protein